MKILVIGSGGREHTLVWKLQQSSKVQKIFCAPGNAGIEKIAENIPIAIDDIESLLLFAKKNTIDLTVIGPEIPLVKGIVDVFEKNGLRIFGPSKLAAELEGSKAYAKNFMQRYNIPTASYQIFLHTQHKEAQEYILKQQFPIVLKADGLAAGKGVVICQNTNEALNVLQDFFENNILGNAGKTIVIENFLDGEEASVFVLTDGKSYTILPAAQDHKRIFDGDKGKNTGGMGAYAPAPIITPEIVEKIEKEIIIPTLNGMKNDGRIYKGCLFIGLMLTKDGPKVMEYNCRFGDPETQVVLPLVDADIAEIFLACTNETLSTLLPIHFHSASAVCVVMASGGYPDKYEVGKIIHGLEKISSEDGVIVFHAGTKKEAEKILSSGGRVLGVTAIGYENQLSKTIKTAYSAVQKITFDGAYYRSDIGKKALPHS